MATETPDIRPAAVEAGAAPAAQAPRRQGLTLAVIATAALMFALDTTIVFVALPRIQAALGFSGSNLEWVVNAYAVTFGGLLLLGGRSGDLLERRRVFIAGLLVFVLASLLGGLATDQAAAGGMFRLSWITEHSTFAGGMLGPELVLGAGVGVLFVLVNLVGLTEVNNDDTGVASSLINVGQQVGGSIGLAVLGTVAWSAVASSLRSQAAAAAKAGVHASGATAAALQTQMHDHALATGFSRGYLAPAGVLALAVIIALAVIRVTRQDLSGADTATQPAGDVTSPSRA